MKGLIFKLINKQEYTTLFGWETIQVIDRYITRKRKGSFQEAEECFFYDYELLCNCDGNLIRIEEDDMFDEIISKNYKLKE